MISLSESDADVHPPVSTQLESDYDISSDDNMTTPYEPRESNAWHNGDAKYRSPYERYPRPKNGSTSDNDPCMCFATRPGLRCTSRSCRHEVKVRNPKPPPTASARPRQLYAAQEPFFDYEALEDKPIVANMRRLQHNGNVDDMSIPTRVDEDPYETDSNFDPPSDD